MLEGINYWDELKESPSQMEIYFAIFANVLELDESGKPTNEKYAEQRSCDLVISLLHGETPGRTTAHLSPGKSSSSDVRGARICHI
jgi:hypothetical protein